MSAVEAPIAGDDSRFTLAEVYADDTRPTIVVDITRSSEKRGVRLEFANDSFTKQYGVLLRFIVSGIILEPDFVEWLRSSSLSQRQYQLGDLTWSSFLIRKRWKIIHLTSTTPSTEGLQLETDRRHIPNIEENSNSNPPQHFDLGNRVDLMPKTQGRSLVIALPSGLVSLGNAPTALEGLHRSVDMLDVGFFEYDLEGTLIFANKSWYTLSGHPYDPLGHTQKRFLELCHPDDIESVSKAWAKLKQGDAVTFEMRWKNASSPSAQILGAQWVSAACIPLRDENGSIRSITGCTTDINDQKLSEKIAKDRALALERARASEQRFVRFAKVAPIVVFNLDANSKMTYCNDRWFEWMATTKVPFEDVNVTEGFVGSDSQKFSALIEQAILDHGVNSVGIRTHRVWHANNGRRAQAWVLVSVFAEFSEEGQYQGCTGTLTDISELKYTEVLQKTQLDDALEAKRSQENFMDTTSHEIRNPLSAMMQCTDSVMLSVSDIAALVRSCPKQNGLYTIGESVVRELNAQCDLASDGLHTIQSCCTHMRSIVDDVLTLSKLDSNLVTITPIKLQPRLVMQDVIKIFEMEARRSDVALSSEIDDSIEELNIDYLMFDPSRVRQILMNLISNAIKFTRTEPVRKVTVMMSAAYQPPNACPEGQVRYTPTLRTVPDGLLNEAQWGTGETLYLQFSVFDTGVGMTPRERSKLFHRFSQASPKTHVVYGGSGLGLFITRQLTELQGGEIGVSSEHGKGSVFAFYIQTRRTEPPESLERIVTPLTPDPTSLADTLRETRSEAPSSSATETSITKKSRVQKTKQAVIGGQITSPSWTPVVLVVEDNIVNQKVLSAQLKRLGCKILVAGNGVEALDAIKNTSLWRDAEAQNKPERESLDIVLMDIEMPIMNGIQAIRAIRQYEQEGKLVASANRVHHQLPIISISANARAEQGVEQKEAGVDDIIIKPFRIPQLMEKILTLVGRDSHTSRRSSIGSSTATPITIPSPASP